MPEQACLRRMACPSRNRLRGFCSACPDSATGAMKFPIGPSSNGTWTGANGKRPRICPATGVVFCHSFGEAILGKQQV